MAKQWIQDNGWKIVVVAATIIAAYAVLTDNVREMKPDVQKNTEYRLADAVDTPYLKEQVRELKTDFKKFTTEQRSVNREILDRLPP